MKQYINEALKDYDKGIKTMLDFFAKNCSGVQHELFAQKSNDADSIDIVSVYDSKLYFTEVKYRKNAEFGGGLEAITIDKQKQMEFAAQCFMRFREDLASRYEPMLAVADVTGGDFRVKEWFELV